SARSLLGVIDDILDVSKIEAGKLEIDAAAFTLGGVFGDVRDVAEQALRVKPGVVFAIATEPGVPDRLVGDALRLRQVLVNLVSNAVKFTERGVVELHTRLVAQTETGCTLEMVVRDSGIGMSAASVARLFQPFTQADVSTTRAYGGTGLGLSICERLVSMMGGSIAVQNAVGVGSAFTVTLPFGHAVVEAREAFVGRRALVVDDSEAAREALAAMLGDFGVEAAAVESGRAAIERVAAEPAGFDLVVVDWKMPGLDGLETIGRLRRRFPERVRRVVLVTAFGRAAEQVDADGLDGFLIKPFNPSMLYDTLTQLWGAGEGEVERAERPSEAEGLMGGALAGRRVLLVEDNAINRQVAEELLGAVGVEVVHAENGQVALDRLAGERFDAVLMDIQMPVMDGVTATRRLRERGETLPVIAMTAHALPAERERCLAAGMDAHVTKPVEPARLYRALAAAVGARVETLPPAAVDEGALSIEGVDTTRGVRRVMGNAALYRRLLRRFVQSGRGLAAAYGAARAAGDAEGAYRLIHDVKGAAGTIGADAVFERASALAERLGDGSAGDMPGADAEEAALWAAVGATCAAVDDALDATTPPAAGPAAAGAARAWGPGYGYELEFSVGGGDPAVARALGLARDFDFEGRSRRSTARDEGAPAAAGEPADDPGDRRSAVQPERDRRALAPRLSGAGGAHCAAGARAGARRAARSDPARRGDARDGRLRGLSAAQGRSGDGGHPGGVLDGARQRPERGAGAGARGGGLHQQAVQRGGGAGAGAHQLALVYERRLSDRLLLNALPERVVDDLKSRGSSPPREYRDVSLLFVDLIDFTRVASGMAPAALMAELSAIWAGFDAVVERWGGQTIKTIGDAYFCVCGMPEARADHARRIIEIGLGFVEFLRGHGGAGGHRWEARVGAHSGAVIAGMVGQRRYQFDVFGDAVNTASRVERASWPMRLTVTESTRAAAGAAGFDFVPRGPVVLKGKGAMPLFFVERAETQ
ncbi:MAG: response regulator, partial [bacterium]